MKFFSIEELLAGKSVHMPPAYEAYKRAQRLKKDEGRQEGLGI